MVRAYVRVSTDEQAEEGFSLPTQRQRITDFCRSQWGLSPALTWYVDDGFSAKDMGRPALAQLRREAAPGDVVVVLRLDRLTRSVLDLYTLLREWDEAGIFFRSVTEPYDTQKPEGRFMIGLLALLAEWERLRISERVREVMANAVRTEGRHLSKPPLGYDLVEGRLQPNPTEAQLVQEIFAMYTGGLGARAIAAALNRRGLRTKQRSAWSDFAVSYVLKNPVYTGMVSWQRVHRQGRRPGAPEPITVSEAHPPLISPATWQAAQALLSQRRKAAPRTTGSGHPLTGLLRCGLCGAPVHGVRQQRYREGRRLPHGERRYYRCSRREKHGDCTLPYLPADQLESRVLAVLPPVAPPERLAEVVGTLGGKGSGSGEDALRAELRRCQRARVRWDEAYETEVIAREEWAQRRAESLRREQELQAALAACGGESQVQVTTASLVEGMGDLTAIWPFLDATERKTLLQVLVSGVVVCPDGSVQIS